MPSSTWTSVLDLDPDHEYVVMATRFEVTGRRHLVAIMGATQQLWQSLPTTAGLAVISSPSRRCRGRSPP
jgi:hypothetical protein